MSRFSSAWIPSVAGPVLLAAASLLVTLGPGAATRHFWPVPDTNLAEAALMHDTARMRALVGRGAALDQPYPVRVGLIDGDAHVLTPLEAARQSGSTDVLQLMDMLLAARAAPAP